SLPGRKHPPLSAASRVREDDRKGGARPRESAQPDGRHCGHALGVENMSGAFSSTFRLLHAARVLARHDALVPREYLDKMPAPAKFARFMLGFGAKAGDLSQPPGVRLARALESLGPAYVKLGQILATRPDIVGDDIAAALQTLQDRLPPFPKAEAVSVIESELARPVDGIFASFGDAVAAASIAQVHMAETREDSPRRVAVKVLRPGVEAEFSRDLS